MSALFGYVGFDGPADADALRRMGGAVSVFGEAEAQVWVDGAVGLGCRMQAGDGVGLGPDVASGRVLLLWGEVYEDGDAHGAVLGAYDAFGVSGFGRVVGNYVAVLWDGAAGVVHLYRSPYSPRAMRFYGAGARFCFCTQPKGLFALGDVPRKLELEYVADYLTANTDGSGDFYAGIERVGAGEVVSCSRAGVVTRVAWEPCVRELRLGSDAAYVEAFEDLLTRVVGDPLRGVERVGLMLSGGFDSTAIAAVACGVLGRRVRSYTEVPLYEGARGLVGARYGDETGYVRAMEGMYPGIEARLVQTRATFLDDLGGMFEHLEAPLPAVANRPWIEEILRLGSEDGVEVMLDGGGGNLTMSWDGSGLIAGLIRELRWVRAWREGEALAKVQGKGVLRVMGGGAMPLLPGWMWRGVQRVRGRGGDGRAPWSGFSAIAPGFAEGQRVMARAAEHHGGWTFRPSWPLTGVRLKTLTLSDPWTHIGAGYQTWFGVRQRSPAVDVRMVEFCLSVPEEQWLRDGQNKWLLRRAMAGRLPEVVLGNRRRGLQCADWLERLQAMRGQAMDLLDAADGSGLAREVLDLGRLRGLVDGLPDVAGTAEELMVTYRTMLCGGLMMAGFLVWFEGKAP